jgi:hypothetical protein
MSPKAFAVLAYLVEHAGRLVTHDGLLEAVWPNVVVEPQAVKKHILAVRSTPRREASVCLATRPDACSNLSDGSGNVPTASSDRRPDSADLDCLAAILKVAVGIASTGTSGYRSSANNCWVRFWVTEKVPPC